MPTYFMHIRDGGDFIEDLEGSDLPDIDAAREEAEAALREMLADRIRKGSPFDGQVIEIYDRSGTKLAEFDLAAPGHRR